MVHSHTHLDADSKKDEPFGERQKKIYDACSSLFHLGFDRKLFTIKNIYKHGYTEDKFLELIKPLASIPGMDASDLFHISCSAEQSYTNLAPYTFTNFLNFSEWLYHEDGKRTLEFLSNKNKNIVRKELTTAEVSFARMLIEYAASRKQELVRIREKIEWLVQQQKKLEMECESIEEELKRKLGPLYEYKEPELPELRIEAYKLYEEDCKSKGIKPIRKRDRGFKKAMELFGDVAKERCDQLVNYLNDPVRQEKVRDFIKEKIFRMEHVTDGGETCIVCKFATDVCDGGETCIVCKFAISMAHSHSHSTHLDADSEKDECFGERQKMIYAACSILFQIGFDRNEFTIENIYKNGYTDSEFLKLIKPLASITDMDMDEYDIRYLSKEAHECSVKLEPYNFLNSVDFAKWLYEADGKRTLEFLTNKKKKNIVRKELTTAEVSLARMFIEYGASHKLERDHICEEIKELSKQQMKMEMEYASIKEELERKLYLGPLYEYKEPEINELRIEAYKLYKEDCKSKGISPIPKRDKGFEKAMELFGNVAKERCDKLVNYLNDPFRQKKVKNFFKGKIYRMEHVTDGGEITIVYKFATDVCGEISSCNIVHKHESGEREENSDGRKVTIIYKFEPDVSDVCEKISNVPPLPDSKKAPKQKAKAKRQEEQEHKGAAKKMKSVTLG